MKRLADLKPGAFFKHEGFLMQKAGHDPINGHVLAYPFVGNEWGNYSQLENSTVVEEVTPSEFVVEGKPWETLQPITGGGEKGETTLEAMLTY